MRAESRCLVQNPGARGISIIRGRPRRAGPAAQGVSGAGDASVSDPALLVLPVFRSTTLLLPTAQGTLRAFEPQFVAMFTQIMQKHPGAGRGGRFFHTLTAGAAPPALLDDSVGGLPRVGCCATVDSIQPLPDGSLMVQYVGHRRMRLLMEAPSTADSVARVAGEWYDDDAPGAATAAPSGSAPAAAPEKAAVAAAGVDVLEQELVAALHRLEVLSGVVWPGRGAVPEAVTRYAPRSAARKTSYDALKQSGHRAATAIDTWRRSGSVYSSQRAEQRREPDPYQAVANQLQGKERRQELFSFAAAQLLEAGVAERAALMMSRDTGARMAFVLAALDPFLAELQAKVAVKGALDQ